MNKKEIVSELERGFQKEKEEVRQRNQDEKKNKYWEVSHKKEAGWGASYTSQESYKNTKDYRYAIWYYYKRLQLLKISLFPFFIAVVFGLLFLNKPSFNTYLIMAIFVGLSRAIGTNGFDNEGQFSFGHLVSNYRFFRLNERERTKKRLKAFFYSLLFPPVLLPWHIYDLLEVLINQDAPIPPNKESYISHPSEEIVGRIDKDGYIYKRD